MKELDTVKLFLIASFILCLAGGGVYWYQVNDLKNLEQDIPKSMLKLKDLGSLYSKWNILKDQQEEDKRHGVQLRTYLENQGHKAGVNYRKLRLDTQSPDPNQAGGYIDQPITITAGKEKFHRKNIANYIFFIENRTNRLKVTELILDKPDEDHEQWTLNMKLVERSPLEMSPKR